MSEDRFLLIRFRLIYICLLLFLSVCVSTCLSSYLSAKSSMVAQLGRASPLIILPPPLSFSLSSSCSSLPPLTLKLSRPLNGCIYMDVPWGRKLSKWRSLFLRWRWRMQNGVVVVVVMEEEEEGELPSSFTCHQWNARHAPISTMSSRVPWEFSSSSIHVYRCVYINVRIHTTGIQVGAILTLQSLLLHRLFRINVWLMDRRIPSVSISLAGDKTNTYHEKCVRTRNSPRDISSLFVSMQYLLSLAVDVIWSSIDQSYTCLERIEVRLSCNTLPNWW